MVSFLVVMGYRVLGLLLKGTAVDLLPVNLAPWYGDTLRLSGNLIRIPPSILLKLK